MAGKNQHYVPQFLLRKWSTDGKSINALLLKSGEIKKRVSISGQCAKRYIYGKDQALEECFSVLEQKVSLIFRRIIDGSSLASMCRRDLRMLHYFMAMQHQRTEQSIARFENMANAIFQVHVPIVRPEYAELVRRCRMFSSAPYVHPLAAAALGQVALQDLKLVCLRNDSRLPFMISDQPVVVSNAQAESHLVEGQNPVGATGYACAGLLLFLPISPENCLLLYDEKSYSLLSGNNGFVKTKERDVRRLNRLQASTARKCLYMDKVESDEFSIKQYCCAYQRRNQAYLATDIKKGKWIRKANGKELTVKVLRKEGGEVARLQCVRLLPRPDLRFCKGKGFPLRSLEIAAAVQEDSKLLSHRRKAMPIFSRDYGRVDLEGAFF